MAGTNFFLYGISSKKFQIHLAFFIILSRVINSSSIMDLVIHICFMSFYNTPDPPSVKTYPLMDFKYLV
jgi:hypothetical protein